MGSPQTHYAHALHPQLSFLNGVHAINELWYAALDALRPPVFQVSARSGGNSSRRAGWSAASPDGARLVNRNVVAPLVAALHPQPAFLNRVHAFDEPWYSTLDTLRPLVFQVSARSGGNSSRRTRWSSRKSPGLQPFYCRGGSSARCRPKRALPHAAHVRAGCPRSFFAADDPRTHSARPPSPSLAIWAVAVRWLRQFSGQRAFASL